MKQGHSKDTIKKPMRSLNQRTLCFRFEEKITVPIVVVYGHPHHIEKQQSVQGRGVTINTLINFMGTRKETNQEAHGGLPTLREDIRL
jgi:hypothetical protein